ncbi:MAG TPA: DUF4856 domain-containing protein [Ferruginibacter sp.]|nr:DUF4856 domain-containing protein [Ferruginibacter sp.]
MKKISIVFSVLLIAIFCWSCTKQVTSFVPVATPFYYPGNYNFTNVNDSNQKKVLLQIDSLMAAINAGNTQGVPVDTTNLKRIFNSTSAVGYSLASLSIPAAQTDILNYFDSIGLFSHSVVNGSDGTAGVGASTLQAGVSYLQSDSGYVYSQISNAVLMEGLIAYQMETNYLYDSVNTSIDTTIMQRTWDAAFGYFGVPINFPTDTTGSKYWGQYATTLSTPLGLDNTIMTNFLIGRAAINNNYIIASSFVPNTTSYAAISDADNIIAAMDKLAGGAAIYELGQAQTNDSLHDDVVARAHLSASWGFIHSLNYNISKARTNNTAQINAILAAYGTDLYRFNYSYHNVDSIKTVIGNMYGFTNTNF